MFRTCPIDEITFHIASPTKTFELVMLSNRKRFIYKVQRTHETKIVMMSFNRLNRNPDSYLSGKNNVFWTDSLQYCFINKLLIIQKFLTLTKFVIERKKI